MKKPLEFRIDDNGCFVCISHKKNSSGTIILRANGEKQAAHRLIYIEMFGEIKNGHSIGFKCGNAGCLNPEHLEQRSFANSLKINFEIDENNCFNCISHKLSKYGYPQYTVNNKKQNMHRFIYSEMHGEISDGHVIRHKCDNRLCINPEHLESGTISQNALDTFERGRNARGEDHGKAKLDEKSVREIIKMLNAGKTFQEIGDAYGVHKSTVFSINKGETWTHLGLVSTRQSN